MQGRGEAPAELDAGQEGSQGYVRQDAEELDARRLRVAPLHLRENLAELGARALVRHKQRRWAALAQPSASVLGPRGHSLVLGVALGSEALVELLMAACAG